MITNITQTNTKSRSFPKESFHSFFTNTKRHERKLLNYYLALDNHYESIFPANEKLSSMSGAGTTTVKKAKKKLQELGIVIQEERAGFSNLVKLNPMFHDPKFRTRYSPFLRALRYIPAKYLHVAKKSLSPQQKDVYLNSVHDITSLLTINYNKLNKQLRTVNRSTVRGKVQSSVSCLVYKIKKGKMNYTNAPWSIEENPPISKIIMALTWEMKLSKRGQIELSCFPATILSSAYRDYTRQKQTRHIERPFMYFMSICKAKCENENLTFDESQRMYLLNTYDLGQYDPFTISTFYDESASTESDYKVDLSELVSTKTKKGEVRKPEQFKSQPTRPHLPEELEEVAQHYFKYQYAIQDMVIKHGQGYLLPWIGLSHKTQASHTEASRMFEAKRKQRLLSQDTSLFELNQKIKKEYQRRELLQQRTMSLEQIREKIRLATTPPKPKTETEILQTEYIPSTANWVSIGEAISQTFKEIKDGVPLDEEIFNRRAARANKPQNSNDDEFSDEEMNFQGNRIK